jgi:hypothetical protein
MSHVDPSKHEFVGGPRRRREETWIEVSEPKLRLVEAPQQEQSPNFEIARMRDIQTVTVLLKRHPGHGFFRTEGPRSAPQQFLRSRALAKLRHRDASRRERWRIVSQGDSLQCSERITRSERACCRSD